MFAKIFSIILMAIKSSFDCTYLLRVCFFSSHSSNVVPLIIEPCAFAEPSEPGGRGHRDFDRIINKTFSFKSPWITARPFQIFRHSYGPISQQQ